jgi:hypothetical protein
MNAHDDIRVGTLAPAPDRTTEVIRQLLPDGFETVQISFGKSVGDANVSGLSDPVLRALDAYRIANGDLAGILSWFYVIYCAITRRPDESMPTVASQYDAAIDRVESAMDSSAAFRHLPVPVSP